VFTKGFEKTATVVKMKATPKKHGGTNGRGTYQLSLDKKTGRWSCTCPDWTIRRSSLPAALKEHWDCKHIRAHKENVKPWDAKKSMQPLPAREEAE
jgi:hypothetical protein